MRTSEQGSCQAIYEGETRLGTAKAPDLRGLALIFAFLSLPIPPDSAGDTLVWIGGESNWDTDDNWNAKRKPTSSDIVEIDGEAKIGAGVQAGSFDARLGMENGGTGVVRVTGDFIENNLGDGTWSNVGGIFAGYVTGSSGRVLIEGGGVASTAGIILGNALSTSGELQVTGTDSTFNSGGLTIGHLGDGNAIVEAGGKIESSGLAALGGQIGTGEVTVNGLGSLWKHSGSISVGDSIGSNGLVKVESGGVISTDGVVHGIVLGGALSSMGELRVIGADSTVDIGGMTVGDLGSGYLTIEAGGKVSATGLTFGRTAAGISVSSISGNGSLLQVTGVVFIGFDGGASIEVNDGAKATSAGLTLGGGGFSGSELGGHGSLTIHGPGSSWESSGALILGNNVADLGNVISAGVLGVQAGGKFSAASNAVIGLIGNGAVTVEGAGSEFSAGGASDSFIGQDWQASFWVFDGGRATFTSPRLILGNSSNGYANVIVKGADSTLTSSGPLIVGINGSAELSVENGGKVSAPEITIGSRQEGFGFVPDVVNLRGGGTPESRGILDAGAVINGGKINFDGGVLRATGNHSNFVQPKSGSPLSVLDIGPQGAFIDTNGFAIGVERSFSGTGGLTKQGEGTLTLSGFDTSTYLGATSVEQGTLQLALRILPRNYLPLGTALMLGNAADVGAAAFNLNGLDQEIGSLSSIGNTMSRVVTNTSATAATLTVKQQIDTTFAGNLMGNLRLTKLGDGKLTLSGASSHIGVTTIAGGALQVDGSIAGQVAVGAGGTLLGHGSVGAVTVQSGGVVSPGTSPGRLQVTGDLVLAPDAVYDVDLDGSLAGISFDQAVVGGIVNVDGARLQISLGFTPTAGELFEIIVNDGDDPILGRFFGLDEGAAIDLGGLPFALSYFGGSGNDLVLQAAVPVPGSALLLASALGLLLPARVSRG